MCRIHRKSAKKRRCKVGLMVFERVLYSAVQRQRLNNKNQWE
ncbi:hypothetical protein C4J87_1230 [Pseudomonas sp. R1-43-08]|nr:hypothetical protein C4J87_1230 [Pseudomonas sp. R1-43-08]